MGETTVLYALTTLAQSCAALAAFVGALGVFRIQMLRDQKRDAERNFHLQAMRVIGTRPRCHATLFFNESIRCALTVPRIQT